MKIESYLSCPQRSSAFVLLVSLAILLQINVSAVSAYAAKAQDDSIDYGGSESIGEKLGQNDEIYTPEQLQQEVEAMERRLETVLDEMNQNINGKENNSNAPVIMNKSFDGRTKQYDATSSEYYDDDNDKTQMKKLEKNNEANVSASDYDDNIQETRDKLKEEIFKSIQEELEQRKSHKNEPIDSAVLVKNLLDKHTQQLPKMQRSSRNFNNLAVNQEKAIPNKTQYDEQHEFYDADDEGNRNDNNHEMMPERNDKRMHTRRKETTADERFKTEAPQQHSTTTPFRSTTTSTSTTLAPELAVIGTSLPTPLALGAPQSATNVNLSTTTATATTITPPLDTFTTTSTAQPMAAIPTTMMMLMMMNAMMTTTATPTESSTTLRPGGKQGKQINILRRKLLPHEKLRNYIEDAYIRMPLAVIVDPSAESLEKTKALWRDALRTNLNIKIILVSLNDSGTPAAYSFNSTRQFLAGLNSLKAQKGGDAFIGIVHASELVPYDSAVFISTATLPPHTELIQDAAITLLKKRIRLYLLWFGERILSENETQDAIGGILGEVAIRSGGDILHIVGTENSQELEGGNHMILIADTFHGPQEIKIPVDTTSSSLHVKVDAPMRTATLETPYGELNLKKLVKFKSNILPKESLDAYVPLTKIRKSTIFTLKIVPEDNDHEYFVFIRADRKADNFLEEMIKRFDSYLMEGVPIYPISFRSGNFKSISTHEKLKFPVDKPMDTANDIDNSIDPKEQVETFTENDLGNKTHEVEKSNATADAVGARTTFENQQIAQGRNLLQSSVTRIEMGTRSQLNVEPGTMAQLYFEVTNTRTEPVFHNVQVVDERRYLARLTPQNVFLRPGETTTVVVTVLVPPNTPQGTIDHITFTCHGSGTASLSVNLRVNSALNTQDNTAPSLTWKFGSRCDYVGADSSNCAERFWTLDITAQDWESGILRLQSTPANRLIYRNSYTVGSTEPLKATYAATCCEPKVSLVAFDVAGNQRSYNIDVRDLYITDAAIAAIVLGCLLLVLLLALLIWWIVICCRRRKIVIDLPTYRSHSTRSME